MTQRFPLIAVIALASVLAVYLFLQNKFMLDEEQRKGMAAPGPNPTLTSEPNREPLPATKSPAGTIEKEPRAGDIEEGDDDLQAAESAGISNLQDVRPEVAWLERYGALNVDDLRIKLRELESRFAQARDEALEDRFTLGQYDIAYPGQAPPAPPGRTEAGMPLISGTRTATDPETSQVEAHIASLPEKDYAALYGLKDEIAWLEARISD